MSMCPQWLECYRYAWKGYPLILAQGPDVLHSRNGQLQTQMILACVGLPLCPVSPSLQMSGTRCAGGLRRGDFCQKSVRCCTGGLPSVDFFKNHLPGSFRGGDQSRACVLQEKFSCLCVLSSPDGVVVSRSNLVSWMSELARPSVVLVL